MGKLFAVIDTETTWNDKVMSIGTSIQRYGFNYFASYCAQFEIEEGKFASEFIKFKDKILEYCNKNNLTLTLNDFKSDTLYDNVFTSKEKETN